MITRLILALVLSLSPLSLLANNDAKTPLKSIVVFGDSLSDDGNTNHLLKSLRQEEDPAFILNPLKNYVFRKMDDFASAYYVPHSVLMAGKKAVQQFFDIEFAPMLASIVTVIRSVPLIPEEPYWNHHFSNGQVWNEELADLIGVNRYNKAVYYNNAFGGSWAATYDHQLTTWNLIRHPILSLQNLVKGKLIPPSLGLEIRGYLMNFGKASPEKAYFIFSGGNDYLNMLSFEDNYIPAKRDQYINYVIDGLVYNVDKLINHGAKKIVLFGVPDIGSTPFFNRTMDNEIATKTSITHNERLELAAQALREKYPEVKITFVNVKKILDSLIDKAPQYGITNTKDACLDVPLPAFAFTNAAPGFKAFGHNIVLELPQYLKTADGHGGFQANYRTCQNPDSYAFWDQVHPSAKVHKEIAHQACIALAKDGYDVKCG